MKIRGSGILLHITSLPGKYGIGDLGPSAYQFVDFLQNAGQRYWQILPIHPTDKKYDNSPYHALSAFAGNPLLISPEQLIRDDLLDESDLNPCPVFPPEKADFNTVITYKKRLFDMAFNRFMFFGKDPAFTRFCEDQNWWLHDFALFMTIRNQYPGILWYDWPSGLKNREHEALRDFSNTYSSEIEKEKFLQYLFSIQWTALLKKCHECGIWLIGDIPIYIDYDSSDVWTNPEFFQLDEYKKPVYVSGVPPDYFSNKGQVWNNPLYSWEEMKNNGFLWWRKRIERELDHVDFIRIDHFRGLIKFWEIPAGSETAINGRWVPVPVWDLLRTLEKKFPYLPIVAEDLGIITPDVREIMREFMIPGMKVLLFAFSSDTAENPYILHNHTKDSFVYTGTHDNNTVLGWFTEEATDIEKERLFAYLGRTVNSSEICDVFIRMAMGSNANTTIIPIQDILSLDSSARMNRPGTEDGNWRWMMQDGKITTEVTDYLHKIVKIYGRL